MAAFPFLIQARDGAARTGVIETPRGAIRTPAFMRSSPANADTSMNSVERGR